MADIIIAFPRLDDAKNLRKLLIRNGYDVTMVCDSGSQVMEAVHRLDGGIVISGYRFSDMYYLDINECLPRGFSLLLLASPAKLTECATEHIVSLAMPFKVQDLLNTLEMMLGQYNRFQKKQNTRQQKQLPGQKQLPRQKQQPKQKLSDKKSRTDNDRKLITAAKEVLMERNQMTEEEAHHYLQKLSMDSGVKLAETAAMLLELNGKEWDI